MQYYTYFHTRNDTQKPFYVGKGSGRRAYDSYRNAHWKNVAKKHGYAVHIAAVWPTESEAFEHERFLIACFRDLGLSLCNMTNGGEGSSGWKAPLEYREAKRVRMTGSKNPFFGKSHTPEQLAANSLQAKKQWAETNIRALHSELGSKLMGNKNPFFGKSHSEETKRAIAKKKLGIPSGAHWSDERRKTSSDRISGVGHHFYGKNLSDEHKSNVSAGMSLSAKGGRFMFDVDGNRRRVLKDMIDTRITQGWVFVNQT